MTTTAVIYTRMSKDRTGAGLGVARQEQQCRELAKKLGLTVVEVYSDNDVSAYRRSKRPRDGYLRLMADLRGGQVEAVVCWHLDRLHRNTDDLGEYLREAEKIPTYTVSGGSFDLTTPSGRATAKTVGAWAQAEVEQKAIRQKAKNRQLAEAGQRIGRGGPVPFGYSEDRVTAHPTWGPLVSKAYADILNGSPLVRVAAEWTKAGAPLRQAKEQRWTNHAVKRVLFRESNAGLVVLSGKVLPGVIGEWETLVSAADYYAVKSILSDPGRRTSPGSKPKHLLSGILHCDSCGSPMRRQKVSGAVRKPEQNSVYACTNRKSMHGNCPLPPTIATSAIEEWFIARILDERGTKPGLTIVAVDGDEALAQGATLAELDERIRSIALQMAEPDADLTSLTVALVEAKTQRKQAQTAPITTRKSSTLTVGQSWSPELPEDALLMNRRQIIRGQLAEGGLRLKPVGRGNRRTNLGDSIVITWAD